MLVYNRNELSQWEMGLSVVCHNSHQNQALPGQNQQKQRLARTDVFILMCPRGNDAPGAQRKEPTDQGFSGEIIAFIERHSSPLLAAPLCSDMLCWFHSEIADIW